MLYDFPSIYIHIHSAANKNGKQRQHISFFSLFYFPVIRTVHIYLSLPCILLLFLLHIASLYYDFFTPYFLLVLNNFLCIQYCTKGYQCMPYTFFQYTQIFNVQFFSCPFSVMEWKMAMFMAVCNDDDLVFVYDDDDDEHKRMKA